MKLRPVPLVIAIVIGLMVAACTSSQPIVERQQRSVTPYEITVVPIGPAQVSRDGFDARFEFEVVSPLDLYRNSLVQELRQTVTLVYKDGRRKQRDLSLVEAFRLRPMGVDDSGRHHYSIFAGQSDRHSMRGLDELSSDVKSVEIYREVFAYVANVMDADFTPAGFAHLPTNEDGSLVSDIPKRFNEKYQNNHSTQGWVRNSGDARGLTYRIKYRLTRTGGNSPHFEVDHGGGFGAVGTPAVVWLPE